MSVLTARKLRFFIRREDFRNFILDELSKKKAKNRYTVCLLKTLPNRLKFALKVILLLLRLTLATVNKLMEEWES